MVRGLFGGSLGLSSVAVVEAPFGVLGMPGLLSQSKIRRNVKRCLEFLGPGRSAVKDRCGEQTLT